MVPGPSAQALPGEPFRLKTKVNSFSFPGCAWEPPGSAWNQSGQSLGYSCVLGRRSKSGTGYDKNVVEPVQVYELIEYIHQNPVKRGLVLKASDWKRSSARGGRGRTTSFFRWSGSPCRRWFTRRDEDSGGSHGDGEYVISVARNEREISWAPGELSDMRPLMICDPTKRAELAFGPWQLPLVFPLKLYL